jgi:type IV pilus assembly protein PilB
MLSLESQQTIEKLIVNGNFLSRDQLEDLKLQAIQKNQPLLSLIAEQHVIGEEELTKLSAQASGVPYVNLASIQVNPDILGLLPKDAAESYMSVPFGMMRGRLAVAMLDPTNVQAVDFLSRKTGKQLVAFMASRASIEHVLTLFRSDVAGDVKAALGGVKLESEAPVEKPVVTAEKVQNLVQDAPITRALNAILDYAVESRASDIHIEPREKELKVRYRIDGILQDTMTLPKSIEPALISRIKILSNLKIDEHRTPQDGQFSISSAGKSVDLRIAIAPITWGEQIVIRLLDKSDTVLTLDGLGMRGRAYKEVLEGIRKPHGMILSTGPTGSGKTTTMYATIQALKDVSINIVTLEDPVEYRMDGINQIQVNADVGLTFANGLRSILRQDPNVVMVGEIRDKETADLAVQAALTGHVVLSTLHTNSAAGVLPRLLDMQIEPFLIASTVNTVIGQRLVRRLCPKCKTSYSSTTAETESIKGTLTGILPKSKSEIEAKSADTGYKNLPLTSQSAYTLYKPVGCSECLNGYKGRIGIYEVYAMNTAMEKLLVARATTSEVQKQAQADGMLTMKQDGYLKALAGLTTIEEVARVASDF